MKLDPKRLFDAIRRIAGRALSQADVDAINAALAVTDIAPTHRNISAAGLALIKRWEGLRLKAYRCPAGIPTIGYGSTGPHVRMGMTITEPQAEALLRQDLVRFERAVNEVAPNATQGQFDAMVSLAFNVGVDAFRRSTLLKRHLAGDTSGAAAAFGSWIFAGGKRLAGLVNRRADEAALYLGRRA